MKDNQEATNEPERRVHRMKITKLPKAERDAIVRELTARMHKAAKELEFEEAARLRDEIAKLRL